MKKIDQISRKKFNDNFRWLSEIFTKEIEGKFGNPCLVCGKGPLKIYIYSLAEMNKLHTLSFLWSIHHHILTTCRVYIMVGSTKPNQSCF